MRAAAANENRAGYTPLDEWLASPRVRILRALRWFDWVEVGDLIIALGMSDMSSNDRQRHAHDKALQRLVESGQVERRTTKSVYGSAVNDYRLAKGVTVDVPMDWSVIA